MAPRAGSAPREETLCANLPALGAKAIVSDVFSTLGIVAIRHVDRVWGGEMALCVCVCVCHFNRSI